MHIITQYLTSLSQNIAIAAGLCIVFGLLSRAMPCNRDYPWFSKGFGTNSLYFLIIPLFTRIVQLLYIYLLAALLFHGESSKEIYNHIMHGYGPLGQLPLWLQAVISFVLSDIILYWTHRWFHTASMWRFHAVHHSSEQLDWHSAYRFHPINIWLSFTLVDVLMAALGLSLQSVIVMSMFNTFYSSMVHANLNWTFGPLRYVLSSPVFHRWHHTAQEEGMDKNFAPTFPLLDLLFGTFYMPKDRMPETYGIKEPMPESFIGQLAWPFRRES